MMEEFKHLYMRFNYSDDKGFIVTVPTGIPKEHLSIGFDNERKKFNVHFTDDSIVEKGALRRNFILHFLHFDFICFYRDLSKSFCVHS